MFVHRRIDEMPFFRNAVVTIGTFDGVHRGHQLIIDQMKREAAAIDGETVIITFHPHPRNIIGGKKGKLFLLTTIEERTRLLETAGIDHLVIVPFTGAFAEQEAGLYIQDFLVKLFQPHTIIIGYDHRFGKDRKGDYHLLEEMADSFNYLVKEIDAQVLQEVTISSTRIREALNNGDITKANALLGYPYFFEGSVIHGDKRGRTLGYPTANLNLTDPEKLIPADGVYAVRVSINVSNQSTIQKSGMMNIGLRPTVDGINRRIEVNIFDFDMDIYGQTMEVSIVDRIRGEEKFSGLDALKDQLRKDREAVIRVLS